MNNFSGIGRITRDIEMRFTPSGMAVSNFAIAIDRSRKDAEGNKVTDFIDVVAFGKTAELIAQYCIKGVMVGIIGELQIDTWKHSDGTNRKSAKIVVDKVDFLSSKAETDAKREAAGVPQVAPAEAIKDDEDPFGDQ